MLFSLGLLGLLQTCVLPGLVVDSIFKFRLPVIQKISSLLGLSLILNYFFGILLTALGMHVRFVWFALLAIEIMTLLILNWHIFLRSLKDVTRLSYRKALNPIIDYGDSEDANEPTHSNWTIRLLKLISLTIACLAIGHLLVKIIYNTGTVFDGWDAILSWNSWARSWANGQIPEATNLYPQLIPLNWSVIYLFLGDTKVQFFSKGIMPFFPLLTLLLLFERGFKEKKYGYMLAVGFTYLIMKKWLGEEIFNGYVDLAAAFFGFLAVTHLLRLSELENLSDKKQSITLAFVFAAGAAVCKQSGVLLLLVMPLLVFLVKGKSTQPKSLRTTLELSLLGIVLALLVSAPWYLYRAVQIAGGSDAGLTMVSGVSMASSGEMDLIPHVVTQLLKLGKFLIFYLICLIGLFFLDKRFRWIILLLIIPVTFFWAYFASYDYRNLAIVVPLLGMCTGLTLESMVDASITKLRNFDIGKTPFFVIFLLLISLSGLIGVVISDQKLEERQINLQRKIFDPGKNENIYSLLSNYPKEVKVLTNYPIAELPGLENNQLSFWFDSYQDFLHAIKNNPEIELVFVPHYADPQILAYLAESVSNGTAEMLFESESWISYTMYELVR